MVRVALASIVTSIGSSVGADSLPVTDDAVFTFMGQEHIISRAATVDPTSIAPLISPAADCPAPCIAPLQAAPGVATYGELDVIAFLSGAVEDGTGLLVDARLPDDRAAGFIPASVNIPTMTVSPTNPYRGDILQALGAQQFEGIFNFDDARHLVIFDHGPTSMEAHQMIADLLAAGYPADKLSYYRGGMQVWSLLGLSVEGGAS